jgi:hypothetical protein
VVENQYGLDRTVNDSGGPRFINGESDGFTWKEAYDNNSLGVLLPHRLTVGVLGGPFSVEVGQNITIRLEVGYADGEVSYTVVRTGGAIGSLEISGDDAVFSADAPGTTTYCITASDGRATPGGSAKATFTVEASYARPEAADVGYNENYAIGSIPFALTGTGGTGGPYTYRIESQPSYGTITGFDPASGTGTYSPLHSGPVQDAFTFSVNDGNATTAPGTVSILLWQEAPPEPAFFITPYKAGKVSDPLAGYPSAIAAIRPNDDNDDGDPEPSDPWVARPADNDDAVMNPADDDIVRVWLAFSPGEDGTRAKSGTATVTLPDSGFKIYTSETGGTPLAAGPYTLHIRPQGSSAPDPNAGSPLAGIMSGGMFLYVETAPGAHVSGEIKIEGALTLEDNSTANPTAKLTLLPVEFKARDQFSDSFDPPLNADVHTPTGAKDEDDWVAWTSVARTGGYNTNTKTKLVFSSDSAASMFELAVANDSLQFITVQPTQLTTAETNLTIHGLPGNTIEDATIEVRAKGTTNVVARLRVLALPERNAINCKFYRVHEPGEDPGNILRPGFYPVPTVNSPVAAPGPATAEIDDRMIQAVVSASPGSAVIETIVDYEPNNGGNGVLDADAEFDVLRQKHQEGVFTGQGNVIYVPFLETGALGIVVDPSSKLIFIAQNEWVASGTAQPDPDNLAPEDADGASYQMARIIAHEFGHYLEISTRQAGLVTPTGGHDNGRFPTGTAPLMREGNKPPLGNGGPAGRWIRHEDWKVANETAKRNLQ